MVTTVPIGHMVGWQLSMVLPFFTPNLTKKQSFWFITAFSSFAIPLAYESLFMTHTVHKVNQQTDPLYSIALSSKSVPMVSVKQTKTQVNFKILT